ncbi:serine/threonine protein kinase [Verrucomicrobia bacterium]|nr:serine/threonine protein kinase [Verrucomicrobiota bacterium]
MSEVRPCPNESNRYRSGEPTSQNETVYVYGSLQSIMLLNEQGGGATLKMVGCGGCGARLFIPADLEPLQTTPCTKCGHPVLKPLFLGQVELREVIASGGMGTVYRSWDHALEREVAVKLMKQEFANDTASIEAFGKEARICACFSHTNIVAIYSFDEQEGHKFISMELTDQGSLEDRIKNDGRIPEIEALTVGIKMCSALKVAQRHDLIHLDIKPDNILFNIDNEPKLVDWGIARNVTEPVVDDGEQGVLGTPEFIAPERVLQTGESFLSDMYSLSGTIYNALVGRTPFTGEDPTEIAMKQTTEALDPPNQLVEDISEETSDAIIRAMAKDPNARFSSYDEFSTALELARSQAMIKRYIRR